VPIAERPAEVADRTLPGHWEADLMLFAKYGQAILTLQERSSRLLLATKPANKEALPIANMIAGLLQPFPTELRRSITFDNGTEFARHYELHRLAIDTFFCDPYAPWQKGGVENAIGRMRRSIPRKTDLANLSTHQLSSLVCAYNNTPRKCLDWSSPAEVFLTSLLHFGWESTSPPSRG
jgi:IS30 family transposase